MKTILGKIFSFLTGWLGDGPWCSKSVLAALAVTIIGLGFWYSDIKNGPPQSRTETVVANPPGIIQPTTANTSAEPHWNWSKPFPAYVRVCASYVVGFCLGWFFRKLKQLVLVTGALVIALLAFGKFAGCNMTPAQERAKQTSEWVQQEVTTLENYSKRMLLSAGAGGAGIFLGFRRRHKIAAPHLADQKLPSSGNS